MIESRALRMVVGSGGLLLVLLLTGCGGAPRDITYTMERWEFGPYEGRKILTDHYEIYATVSDDRLLETFPETVERSYDFYTKLVPPQRAPRKRMPVYLFATRSQWAFATQRMTGDRADVFLQIRNGGFSHDGVSNIQYVSHATTFPLLAHEGFHQYLHHCVSPNVPAWVNEGLAVVCECQRWQGDGLREFDPWYNPRRRNRLAESVLKDRLYPLKQILATHAGEVVHETSARVGTYYAQVWALMLFLWDGEDGKYAERFEALCAALGSPELQQRLSAEQIWADAGGVSRGEALFRSFISDDVEQVEREFHEYLRRELLTPQG